MGWGAVDVDGGPVSENRALLVLAGLAPAIHVFLIDQSKPWMPMTSKDRGPDSPAAFRSNSQDRNFTP